MLAIIRKNDNLVVNDRQSGDYHRASDILTFTQRADASTDATEQRELRKIVTQLTAEQTAYFNRRIDAILTRLGGERGDFMAIRIPKDEERDFFSASYVTYDGDRLHYERRPSYSIDGATITCHPRWVRGNYRLKTEDTTDFSAWTGTLPVNFALHVMQHEITQEIGVKLFTWAEDEQPGAMTLTNHTMIGMVCQGTVSQDKQITITK